MKGAPPMTTNEMKNILASKLASEGTYFTKSHISIRQLKNGYRITIKDYEHIPFKVILEDDDYFGKCVMVKEELDNEIITFKNSKKDFPLFESLLSLGYYIGTHF
jgi:hypothetical protein